MRERKGPSARLNRRATTALLVVVGLLGLGPSPASGAGSPPAELIVQGASTAAAAAAVDAVGGTVIAPLPIVAGVSARVPEDAVEDLRVRAGVRAVTENSQIAFASTGSGSGSPNHVYPREIGADRMWASGFRGEGMRVALIDTGVTPGADLAGRIIGVPHPTDPSKSAECVNFSGESGCTDSYGHGTFMAGIIAGDGTASGGVFTGVAPKAEIVSIKIAGRDGSADVTKVLAAIQWVVSFADELNIRVLNLSLGTNSTAPTHIDPLNLAVQRAWDAGIVVVVAASNRGPDPMTISKPADDPLVITVGAVDDRETPAIDDDRLPRFSARGPTHEGLAKPDVVAPGARVVSLRSPGSYIDTVVPGASIGDTYRRGSGTSMAAAVTSGATALVLQARPGWEPDRVKFAFRNTARKVAERDPLAVGAGLIQAYDAVFQSNPKWVSQQRPQRGPLGSLDASRGTVRVTRPCTSVERLFEPECPKPIRGNETARGTSSFVASWDAEDFTSEWTGSSWYESQWVGTLGSSWYGSSWYGNLWQGSSWYGSSWYGNQESTTAYGTPLEGSSWYGAWG